MSTTTLRLLTGSGYRREPSAMPSDSQIAHALSFEAPEIDIGGARLNNLTVSFGDLHVFNVWSMLEEPALLIGMDLLGTLEQFVVDYSRREFHLKPVSSGRPTLHRCGNECNTRIPRPDA